MKVRLYSILSAVFLFMSMAVMGQSYQPVQRVQMIEHTIIIPEGGTLEEALKLSQEWAENVLRKNENFENIQLLLSDVEKDTVSLMVLYKYRLNTTRDTNEINQELIRAHWPEEGAFEKFLARLHAYIDPKLNKRSVFRELVLK